MRVLLIGSGGREHALAWKIRQSPIVTALFCAPGNPGINTIAESVEIKATDTKGLLKFAREQSIDLTIVGPEQPLAEGIVDLFEENGLTIFGPTKAASELECSKVFAKEFMKKYAIPTAEFRSFTVAERFDAERYINEVPIPIVIKADGLAAGKGVAVCETKEQALEVLDMMMEQKAFGDAGLRVVIEEFLVGDEASVFVITDGKEFIILPPAQDHKRILDADQGKNTGGMGAYAPAPIVTDQILERIRHAIIKPTLVNMAKEGRPYRGCLYVGLMITETGPKVVEYNCRFGDPETQVLMPLLDSDLVTLFIDASSGNLKRTIKFKHQSAVCVILASGGYPDSYETGKHIVGLDVAGAEPDVLIFHSGTKQTKEGIVTAGGRVLGVTALGQQDDLEGTIDKAYRAVEKIAFDGAYYRSDIGKKGVERLKQRQQMETR
ncbi:MAG: phosphoribosylamine--glycine ligase [Ignavibacteria bacterium]|nr:phosphoribosylamine--glycine ligase [Ignavibacteria bacterium]MBI3766363.1 phosphoribosylamine--glycine ligase [Ignavibacteriales bacterium]